MSNTPNAPATLLHSVKGPISPNTFRKNVVFWDLLPYLLICLTASMAVLSVGP
jgi:hypothetical protein